MSRVNRPKIFTLEEESFSVDELEREEKREKEMKQKKKDDEAKAEQDRLENVRFYFWRPKIFEKNKANLTPGTIDGVLAARRFFKCVLPILVMCIISLVGWVLSSAFNKTYHTFFGT